MDIATPILQGDQTLSDEHRAQLWDVFNQTKDPQELAQKLGEFPVANALKNQLMEAKTSAVKPQGPAAVQDVISQMAQLDPDALEIAEAHPNVLKALVTATQAQAQSEVKAPTTEDDKKKKTATAPTPAPRADGVAHLPPIPEGHFRVRRSNGAIHDVPHDKMAAAQEIDPNLTVLNM